MPSLLSQDMGEGDEARPVAGAHARAAVGRMDSEDQENVGDHANVGASGGGEDLGSRPSRYLSNIFRSTRWPCNDWHACHNTTTSGNSNAMAAHLSGLELTCAGEGISQAAAVQEGGPCGLVGVPEADLEGCSTGAQEAQGRGRTQQEASAI